jgi:hypothetical protein
MKAFSMLLAALGRTCRSNEPAVGPDPELGYSTVIPRPIYPLERIDSWRP